MDIKYFKCAVFDLDGTLIDSHETIYRSTVQALDELNIKYHLPRQGFNYLIGFHFLDIFKKFNVEVADFEEFIKIYKSFYINNIDTSIINDGVVEILEYLKSRDIKLGVLTTKGQDQVEFITEYFKIDAYFDVIKGRNPGEEIKPSPVPLLNIFDLVGVAPDEGIIIGDAEIDIRCGKNAGASTCAVTFGYRDRDQITKEDPDYIIDHMNEIKTIINSK